MKLGFGARLGLGLVCGALLTAFVMFALPAGRGWAENVAGAAGELLFIAITYVTGAVATVFGVEWVMVGRVFVPQGATGTEG